MDQDDLSFAEAIAVSAALPLAEEVVTACLLDRPGDEPFRRAFERGLATLPIAERTDALGGTTGHIAESVVASLLEDLGFFVVWQFTGPGPHGIDLLELSPNGEFLLAIEVKGTLRPRRWPRLTQGDLRQFTSAWLDKRDNPGMAEWDLDSTDIYGAIVLVNFADRLWKSVVTADFASFQPINEPSGLAALSALPRQ